MDKLNVGRAGSNAAEISGYCTQFLRGAGIHSIIAFPKGGVMNLAIVTDRYEPGKGFCVLVVHGMNHVTRAHVRTETPEAGDLSPIM